MKNITKILTFVFIAIMISSFAHAYADVTFNFNNNEVTSLAYNCLDAACSQVTTFSGTYENSQTTYNGEMTIIFPSTLASQYGYAIYFYSPGMIPKEYVADFHTSGDNHHYTANYNINFEQVEDCQSIIDEFVVVNDVYANEPLAVNVSSSLSAKTASAFSEIDNGVAYVPPSMIQRYYSSDVRVQLYIYDENNNIVNLQNEDFTWQNGNSIYMDGQVDTSFSWTPTYDGRYTAIVRSSVIDAQCSNTLQASSEKDFNVLPSRPTNECYTLINGLDVNNSYPNVNEPLEFTYTKISNYADNNHILTAVPTTLNYNVYLDGTLVDSGVTAAVANSNNFDAESYTFTYTPTVSGDLSIVVTGIANSPLCNGLNNEDETAILNFRVKERPRYNIEFQATDSINGNHIENVGIYINNLGTIHTDTNGEATFSDVLAGTYNYVATHSDYYAKSGTVTLVDGTIEVYFTMVPRDPTPTLQTTLNCFDEVIENHEQSCSVFVTGLGNPIGGATVDIYYDNNVLFGSCTTDSISGGCRVNKIENTVGTYTVQATASLSGWHDGVSTPFTYDVLRERYDIVNLRVFNDAAFTQEDYTFYRGEDMYVSFESVDTENNNVPVPDLVSQVTLVSTPGGRADLTLISQGNGFYYYRLTPIPTTHDYLGDSQAFAFVFNFTDNSGGQEVVDLTILNNEPTITLPIPDQEIEVGQSIVIDLDNYGYDVEDSGNDLIWSVSGVDNLYITANVLNGNVLELTGVRLGSDLITLTLTDLDGASVSQDITVDVVLDSTPECRNGRDDDLNGYCDWNGCTIGGIFLPADPGCVNSEDDDESGYVGPTSNLTFVNSPPTTAYVGLNYTFDLDAISTIPGATILYSVVEGPISINSFTGEITWMPLPQYIGKLNVTVLATDGSSYEYLTWTIDVKSQTSNNQNKELGKLNVMRIRFPGGVNVQAGDLLALSINLDNNAGFDLDNTRISIVSYDLGIRNRIGPFDLDDGDEVLKTLYLEIPKGTPKGEYEIRITMGNDDERRVKHRYIRIM